MNCFRCHVYLSNRLAKGNKCTFPSIRAAIWMRSRAATVLHSNRRHQSRGKVHNYIRQKSKSYFCLTFIVICFCSHIMLKTGFLGKMLNGTFTFMPDKLLQFLPLTQMNDGHLMFSATL